MAGFRTFLLGVDNFNGTGGFGQSTFCDAPAGFVTRISADGSAVLSSTYLGGVVDFENVNPLYGLPANLGAFDITMDSSQNIYVAGVGIALDAFTLTTKGNATITKMSPSGTPPLVTRQSVTDALIFQSGLPQGGGLATAFVSGLTGISGIQVASGSPLPTNMQGASVKVNGELAPILAIAGLSNGTQQINFQVPVDQVTPVSAAGERFRVEVNYNGVSTFTGVTPLPPTLPAASGGLATAVQHAKDYSLVTSTNPIVPGEVIIIYGTGFGPLTPVPSNGIPFSSGLAETILAASINGTSCPILYSGVSPGFVGLYQVNCITGSQLQSGTGSLGLQQRDDFLGSPLSSPSWYSNQVTVWVK